MLRTSVVLAVLAVASPCFAYSYDKFYGWAPDGSYYLQSDSGTDMVDRPILCLSDAKAGSSTWPLAVPRPEEDSACAYLCNVEELDCDPGVVEKAEAWVSRPKSAKKGPHGETVSVKLG